MWKLTVLLFALFFCAPAYGDPFKATLILEHDGDSPWNALLKSGFEKGAKDFNLDAAVIVAPANSAQEDIFRNAAGASELVIVASDNLHEILRNNAANFRRVMFGAIDAGIRAPNIMSVTFADEQAAFLAGVAAAMLTTAKNLSGINPDKTIGWLSGADTPAMRSLFNGYCEGARLVDPQIRIAQAVVGSFNDPELAAEKTAALVDAGADVIVLGAGAGNGAARDVAGAKRALVIDLDAAEPAPGSIATIAKALDKAVYEIVASAARGKFRGKEIIVYNLENKGVDLAGLDRFIHREPKGTPAEVYRRVNELRGELAKGSIRIKSLRARTLCDCLD